MTATIPPRPYVAGKRRVTMYMSMSYPLEAGAPLSDFNNRNIALFELRRLLYGNPDVAPPTDDPVERQRQLRVVGRLSQGVSWDADLERRLGEIEAPTLILMGTLDGLVPPEMGRVYKERIPDAFARPEMHDLNRILDYATYGGAPLLGIRGVAIICHGSSSPNAIANGIRVAVQAARAGLSQHIGAEFALREAAAGA